MFSESLSKIAFIHVPKTAGTSLRHYFRAFMGDGQCFPPYPEMVIRKDDLENENLRKSRMVYGHLDFDDLYSVLSPEFSFATAVREPIAHARSNYNNMKKDPDNSQYYGPSHDMGFVEFVKTFSGLMANYQSKYLAGACGVPIPVNDDGGINRESIRAFDRLIDVLEKFSFIIITEEIDRQLPYLALKYGFPPFRAPRENVTNFSGMEARDKSELMEIRKYFSLDFVLYEYACTRMERELSEIKNNTEMMRMSASADPYFQLCSCDGAWITFGTGWHPRGGNASGDFWWSGPERTSSLLMKAKKDCSIQLSVEVIATANFKSNEISIKFQGEKVDYHVEPIQDGSALTFRVPVEKNGVYQIEFEAPRVGSFFETDPSNKNYTLRGFAIRKPVMTVR